MLSENIRSYRKKNNMSQDELAEKVGVSRQSVSFWETGQTQPTIDNIIALTKIFNISSDMLLGTCENTDVTQSTIVTEKTPPKQQRKIGLLLAIGIAVAVVAVIGIIIVTMTSCNNTGNTPTVPTETVTAPPSSGEPSVGNADTPTESSTAQFDLFAYCKNFALEKGTLNGDYCIYQQPATKYGGYENEYFSISYWSDSDMVELCLHCPLSETQSHNFYLRMRGGYNHKYEYASSKYYRDTGESLRFANGYIDPAVFSSNYPIPCDVYEGSTDGQTEFMEQSRVGICDLILCLKQFVAVENMECDFSDFEFVNF